MVRTAFVLILFAAYCITSLAAPIDEGKARENAMQFLCGRTNASRGVVGRGVELTMVRQSDAYFIFNVNDGGGWVIAAADDCMDSILAFSDDGQFYVGDIQENVERQLALYDRLLCGARLSSSTEPATEDDRPSIEPMIKTKWGQYAPFNTLLPTYTPKDGGAPRNSAAGCTTIAMAQLMYYYKWPKYIDHEINSYDYGETLPPTAINWDVIKEEYVADDSTDSAKEVSKLIKYICWAVECLFQGAHGTGGNPDDMLYALSAHMNYSSQVADTYWLQETTSKDSMLDKRIYEELSCQHPVLMAIGMKHVGMHEIVIDGYQRGGFFHFNCGWYGRCDGYYRLVNDSVGYHEDSPSELYCQFAIFGATPRKADDKERVIFYSANCSKAFFRQDKNEAFDGACIEGVHLINSSLNSMRYDIGVRIYKDEKLIDSVFCSTVNLEKDMIGAVIPLPWGKNCDDGTYTIRLMSRQSGTQEWLNDIDEHYVMAIVKGNCLYLCSPKHYENYICSTPVLNTDSSRPSTMFDLQGRRLTTIPAKGIYIQNGRKHVVR